MTDNYKLDPEHLGTGGAAKAAKKAREKNKKKKDYIEEMFGTGRRGRKEQQRKDEQK